MDPIIIGSIWGGYSLSNALGRETFVSELWEFINTTSQCNKIESGSTDEFISNYINPDDFQIIVKIINAESNLSVQVHPNKSELLYILELQRNAKIGIGLKVNSSQDLDRVIDESQLVENLYYYPLQNGTMVYIPAGQVHVIPGGILAVEIQNSFLETYRLYDYDRELDGETRKLNLKEAKEVISYNPSDFLLVNTFESLQSKFKLLFSCAFFDVYRISIVNERLSVPKKGVACSIVRIGGNGFINSIDIKRFQSVFALSELEVLQISSDTSLELIVTTKHLNISERLYALDD